LMSKATGNVEIGRHPEHEKIYVCNICVNCGEVRRRPA
jgi:hypothetical protein